MHLCNALSVVECLVELMCDAFMGGPVYHMLREYRDTMLPTHGQVLHVLDCVSSAGFCVV